MDGLVALPFPWNALLAMAGVLGVICIAFAVVSAMAKDRTISSELHNPWQPLAGSACLRTFPLPLLGAERVSVPSFCRL